MSEETSTNEPMVPADAPPDTRKEWVVPEITELPVNESAGFGGSGPDLGVYS
jgi:hypothetical protein